MPVHMSSLGIPQSQWSIIRNTGYQGYAYELSDMKSWIPYRLTAHSCLGVCTGYC